MTTRKEFINAAISKGLPKEKIAQAMELRRSRLGAFSDDTIEKQEQFKAVQPVKESKAISRPVFGLPKKGEEVLFPRVTETKEKGGGMFRTAVPGALDIISIPGRGIASLPALKPGGESFIQAFQRTGGKKRQGAGKVAQFAGDIIRDPITYLTMGAGKAAVTAGKVPLTGVKGLFTQAGKETGKAAAGPAQKLLPLTAVSTKVKKTAFPYAKDAVFEVIEETAKKAGPEAIKKTTPEAIKKIGKAFVTGAKEQIKPAVTRQVEISSRTGEVDLPGQTGEAILEVGAGGLGAGAGAAIAKRATPFGKKLLQASAKTKDVTARLAGKDVAEGAENIINDIVHYKLESPTGGFSSMADKAKKLYAKKGRRLDKVVDEYVQEYPEMTIDVEKVLNRVKRRVEAGYTDVTGGEKAAATIIDDIKESLNLPGRKLGGIQPVKNIRLVKQTINKHVKPFEKGVFDPKVNQKAEVGRIAYRAINEEFGKLIPEVKTLGNDMRRIEVVRKAMSEAQKRVGNHNYLSLRNSFGLFFGISGVEKTNIVPTLAMMAFLKLSEKGRGGSALVRLGRKSGTQDLIKLLAAESAALSQREKQDTSPLTPEENLQLITRQEEMKKKQTLNPIYRP